MKKLFLVGCARSGTSWLQIILGSHDAVATVRETHLFDNYIARLYESWDDEARVIEKDGIRFLIDQAEFDAAARTLADLVLGRIEATKPGAAVMLEKTPSHIWHHRLIKRLYPDALFLHIARDPRAVVASMLAANRENWGVWAPGDVLTAARVWRDCVRIGHRELAAYGDQAMEIRYEDLHARPDETLRQICAWLDIPAIPYDPARFSIDRVKEASQNGPESSPGWDNRANFFRRGRIDGWAEELSSADIAVIEGIAGQMFYDLGYVPHR
jgi:hypothetical protein